MKNNHKKSNYVIWLSILGAVILIIIVAAVIIDTAAHSGTNNPVNVTTTAEKNVAPSVKTGNKIGEAAPDFTLKTTDGQEIKLSDYRGKNIILNFWATWCGPCRFEMPAFQAIHEKWAKEGVVLLAINTQDGAANALSYAESNNFTFVMPVDVPGKVAELYGVRGLPTSFIIDSEGIIKSVKIGPFISTEEIEQNMSSFK